MAGDESDVTTLDLETAGLKELVVRRRDLADALKKAQPDVVVANSLRAAIALSFTPKRCAWAYYLRQDMSAGSVGRLRRAFVLYVVLPRFDTLIANSQWTLSTVPPKTRTKHRLAIASPLSGAEQLLDVEPIPSHPGTPLRVGWMGRVVDWKGLHVLIEALDLLHAQGVATTLQVAGSAIHEGSAYMEALQRAAQDRNFRIDFLGQVSDIRSFLSEQDVLAHTSVRPEPFGQVIIQGMAVGLPVIATDVGGPAEIIEDGLDGFRVAPGDPVALAEALRPLAADSALRRRVGMAAREKVRRQFTDRTLANELNKAIELTAARRS
ncbi:glycosyltransferase [Aeromicrobium senzhongii]|uniref:Glycosyltransferase n=1 Tax=Aeromicrobium senzhongii TaxID=2663859 RepID=A0ABX6SYL4_9ACTN|nr:glycosyltransferase [Aeromicrobium senzhongii]QNL94305.1 glycosyltransferase [Aeromicrobium senzhongii]